MANRNANPDLAWLWPEKGRNQEALRDAVRDIQSPYEVAPPPMCYPGTMLDKALLRHASLLMAMQINSIGSHTHVEFDDDGQMTVRIGEGGFDQVQRMEREALWMIASTLGAKPTEIDGYFCGGGTEANIEGLWIGREYLRRCPDPFNKGICVFTTPLQHYSIAEACRILDLDRDNFVRCTKCQEDHIFRPDVRGCGLNFVGMNVKGEMDIGSLRKEYEKKFAEGFRQFLIVPTVGTTVMGSIDPIALIGDMIRAEHQNANFYMHIDASFAGFTVPFVDPHGRHFFQVPEVMSVTVDADKMGRLPYPAGVFLCRKGLMSNVARKVNYVRGGLDDTISGSRSCLAPVLAWYLYQAEGREGQREYVQRCLDQRDRFLDLIKSDHDLNWVRPLPHSPFVNLAPLMLDFPFYRDGFRGIPPLITETPDPQKVTDETRPIAGLLEPYHLRRDFFPSDPYDVSSCPRYVYKFCIMPHHQFHDSKDPEADVDFHLKTFLTKLKFAYSYWYKLKEAS
jgi:tyrosine decarboxylase/aspartate 1-decarboxylase